MATGSGRQHEAPVGWRVAGLSRALSSALPDEDLRRVSEAAARIDAVAAGSAPSPGWGRSIFPGWQSSPQGIRLMKRGVRFGLYSCRLPAAGNSFQVAYEYVCRHY